AVAVGPAARGALAERVVAIARHARLAAHLDDPPLRAVAQRERAMANRPARRVDRTCRRAPVAAVAPPRRDAIAVGVVQEVFGVSGFAVAGMALAREQAAKPVVAVAILAVLVRDRERHADPVPTQPPERQVRAAQRFPAARRRPGLSAGRAAATPLQPQRAARVVETTFEAYAVAEVHRRVLPVAEVGALHQPTGLAAARQRQRQALGAPVRVV